MAEERGEAAELPFSELVPLAYIYQTDSIRLDTLPEGQPADPMCDPELSEQTEWFHQFAKQPTDQIAMQATETNRALFERFVIASLPGHTPHNGQLPEEFARAVVDLRENERKWNQALMSVMIHADDLYKSHDFLGAVSALESFAESCPWKLFHDAARNHANNYRSR